MTINGIYSKSKEVGYDNNSYYSDIWKQPAYMPFYNADGSVKGQHYWYDGNDYMTFGSPFEDLSSNPVDEYYNNTHKNVSTTQIYADLVNAKKRETANKISLK